MRSFRARCLGGPATLVLFGLSLTSQPALAESDDPPTDASQEVDWHVRLGAGVAPVFSRDEILPEAHTGFAVYVSGFAQLPYRLSLGASIDQMRYRYDSSNHGDPPQGPPRYTDERLKHTQLLGLLQWDPLTRGLVNPFVLVGGGYDWGSATLTDWQCVPKTPEGPVVSFGAGVDVAILRSLGVGLEYRGSTLPFAERMCTAAYFPDEPRGAPSDFLAHRITLTLSVRDPF